MARVIFIVGLPGSGKSTLIDNEYVSQGYIIFDDYKNNSIQHIGRFNNSRNFCELINALKQGKDCVVSDIDFCDPISRTEAETFLEELVPEAKRKWIFYENNPVACKNALDHYAKTRGKSIEDKKTKLDYYTRIYQIPIRAVVRPVWQPS